MAGGAAGVGGDGREGSFHGGRKNYVGFQEAVRRGWRLGQQAAVAAGAPEHDHAGEIFTNLNIINYKTRVSQCNKLLSDWIDREKRNNNL